MSTQKNRMYLLRFPFIPTKHLIEFGKRIVNLARLVISFGLHLIGVSRQPELVGVAAAGFAGGQSFNQLQPAQFGQGAADGIMRYLPPGLGENLVYGQNHSLGVEGGQNPALHLGEVSRLEFVSHGLL